MADDFYGYDDDGAEPKGRDNLFLWTIFILLLIGVAAACWMGSFYVFGHPERPKPYALLKKLKKITPPLRFEVTAAPPGEFLNAQKLFEKYGSMKQLELERENGELIRNYIRNYRETKKLVTYATGRYLVMDSYELKPTDMFPTGVVALAQSAEFPQVVIEQVYTSAPRTVPILRTMMQTGFEIRIQHSTDRYDCSAVIHVERIPDGRMQFTLVPILYGSYALAQGSGTFSLEPPPDLNMVPGLPVIKRQTLDEGLKKFANYRRDHPLTTAEAGAIDPNAPKPELVRVDTIEPGKPVPESGALPPVPVATPMAVPGQATPKLIAAATPPLHKPPATPSIEVTMLATPAPVPATRPTATGTPLPTGATPLPKVSPDGVKLQPFIAAQRDPSMGTNGASWRTYAAGQAPAARAISIDEVAGLADRGEVSERLYLRGEFRVTASGSTRAVLRDATKPDEQSPRIVVEYPAGALPPQEKERFVRDNARPYLISDIRRGADGVVTVYVREIMNP